MVILSPQRTENTAFFSGFSLADFMAETLYRLFPPNFKEKASTIFYGTPSIKAFAGGGGSANRAGGFGGRGKCTPFPKDSPPSLGYVVNYI